MDLLKRMEALEAMDDDLGIDNASKKKKSKNEQIYELMLSTPICYISGKFFDTRTNKEIKRYEKSLQKLAIMNFNAPFSEADMKYAIECIRVKDESDDFGIWPNLELWQEARRLYDEDPKPRHKAAFELTHQQLIIIYYLVYMQDSEIMFITTGKAKTGKSTYLNIVRQLFENDFSSATLSDLTSNEFVRATAIQHRLICSDEINSDDVDAGILKTLISRQPTLLNAKNMKPIEIKSQSSLFYCCNKEPRIDITDTGIMRRVIFYRRDKRIENADKSLKTKVYTKEELLDFLILAIYTYDFFMDKDIDPLDIFAIDTGHYIFQSNSVFRFYFRRHRIPVLLDNTFQEEEEYRQYREWCQGSGYRAYNEQNFELVKEALMKALEVQTMESIAKKYND